tara:strand:- start:155 stop:1213 length:1059 start_codon:yes stop_codon:yes gene_type:complete
VVFKLLLVEDVERTRGEFIASIERYVHESKDGTEFDVVECSNVREAFDVLDSTFDGAVVDLKLGDEGGEGNLILERLYQMNLRIPVVVLTGTPDGADDSFSPIRVLKKGAATHIEILEDFRKIQASGLTSVMGGRGQFETLLNRVYKDNIMPAVEVWKGHGSRSSERTERALMRHTLNHLIQLVDLDQQECVPDEFYIWPPVDAELRTGCVVAGKKGGNFVVMNPLCDLTQRADGTFSANYFLLARVETFDEVFSKRPAKKKKENLKADLLDKLRANNSTQNYHALPKTGFISEGFLNFESVISVPKDEFVALFSNPFCQISPAFSKDIVSRFSSFLGRQGQPLVDYSTSEP